MQLTGLCREHSFESAAELCRRCGLEYCEGCVVYPFGTKKPLCKHCAIAMSGVRSHGALPAMPPRLVKKRTKAFAAGTVSAAAPMPEPTLPEIHDPTFDAAPEPAAEAATPTPTVPAAAEQGGPGADVAPAIDWSQPFG